MWIRLAFLSTFPLEVFMGRPKYLLKLFYRQTSFIKLLLHIGVLLTKAFSVCNWEPFDEDLIVVGKLGTCLFCS